MKKDTFGNTIREMRGERGYSIKQLATNLKVNYTYLSKIENNERIPSEDFIERIAEAFNVDAEELKLQAGKIPEDVKRILSENPKDAIAFLRREFGGRPSSEGSKKGTSVPD